MARVELKGISKVYDGSIRVVDTVDVVVEDKEFVAFVGPSGCGKSTTLRMIAGLEDITEGELLIDGELINDTPPKDRNIAMVFQNYALYPHMTVYENMAFGLRIKKMKKDDIDKRVREAAKILDIEKFLDRKPKALSGGQRQRVALGRAIVRQPKVFLFDEPLSNLDAKLRVQMRAELSSLRRRLDATMIYVTHDQAEAMTMADKIVVYKDGKVQQIGPPLRLYNYPANKFVAGFIGSPPMNFLTVTVVEEDGGVMLDEGSFRLPAYTEHAEHLKKYADKEVYLSVRPEDLILGGDPEAKNSIPLLVSVVEPLGAETMLRLNTKTQDLVARMPPNRDFTVNEELRFTPRMENARYFDKETEFAILPQPEPQPQDA
ncbi:MAG: sn-glycerol-3-phosphate ABC transporter ATP-binding protein UgpC [Spirochaetaceae bacterium]|jgi:multiple sugar transport system ATP-binding protein|nr:sn-glycerol-3-phosphate ABC transporter ATP-binding protein UgpC [Spirochaetaceae bacterium]